MNDDRDELFEQLTEKHNLAEFEAINRMREIEKTHNAKATYANTPRNKGLSRIVSESIVHNFRREDAEICPHITPSKEVYAFARFPLAFCCNECAHKVNNYHSFPDECALCTATEQLRDHIIALAPFIYRLTLCIECSGVPRRLFTAKEDN